MAYMDQFLQPDVKTCECEDRSHLLNPDEIHPYGAEVQGVHVVETWYGPYNVCQECHDTCLNGYCKEVR